MKRNKVILPLSAVLAATLLAGCTTAANSASSVDSASIAEPAATESATTEPTSATSEAPAPTVESQTINLTSVGNARELGGYVGDGGRTVRRGVLLRTAALGDISSKDKTRLTDEYDLATMVDFRMTTEVEQSPEVTIEGVSNVGLHIIDEEQLVKMREKMSEYLSEDDDPTDKFTQLKLAVESGFISDQMYVGWLESDAGQAGYAAFFEELEALPEGRSLLFHCTQGKDRTGIAAILVLSVLGVDEQTIMQDYLLTNEFNADAIAQERAMLEEKGLSGDELELYLVAMDGANERLMTNALDWIKKNYGSPIDYAKQELGVTDEQIEALRDKFLE